MLGCSRRSLLRCLAAFGALMSLTSVAAAATPPAAPAAADLHADQHAGQGSIAAPVHAGNGKRSPYLAAQHLEHADLGYALQWGVDSMQVHATNAGNLIRFSYRVVDANKAKLLIDKGASPMMVAPRLNVALQVPVMDKIGPLRQSTEVEPGKIYWMAFSNKGQLVKPGERVSVWVGGFRVDGLVVQ